MVNSIRTPKEGTSDASRRIANAVDNEEWQQFRLSLKGLSTKEKLVMLRDYWDAYADCMKPEDGTPLTDEDWAKIRERAWRAIRVDNYIKALCRGGQLFRGESLQSMIRCNWNPDIKS